MRYNIFLRWWLFATLIVVGSIFCWNLGILHEVWSKDSTKLSFFILAICGFHTLWAGMQSFSISRELKHKLFNDKLKTIERHSEIGWFASDICLNVGMIGTIWGFIQMLGGFINCDVSDIESVQGLLTAISGGMSVALYTTLTGLICSQLLKIQFFNIDNALEYCKSIDKKE